MGWKSGKALNNYAPGKKIGGDVFRDDYNKLPKASNRIWYEADVGINYTSSRANNPGYTTKVVFYEESEVYPKLVESYSGNFSNIINYVNYFTSLYDGTFTMTAAQLRAVEMVLEKDYAA